jgi:hypothetical protein
MKDGVCESLCRFNNELKTRSLRFSRWWSRGDSVCLQYTSSLSSLKGFLFFNRNDFLDLLLINSLFDFFFGVNVFYVYVSNQLWSGVPVTLEAFHLY